MSIVNQFKMIRLLIILFICVAFISSSCGQNPAGRNSTPTVISKVVQSNNNPLPDTAFLNQLASVYGDSIYTFVDSLLKDSGFLQSIGDTSVAGEFASSQYKIHFPVRPLGWVSDYEHIFSGYEIPELDSLINEFEKETTKEIAIVTIPESWTTKESFDSLTLAIAKNWGIGKENKSNGILIGISTGLKTIRIQNGYGIVTKMSDAETKKILDDIILPEFKEGKYFEGTKAGLLAIMRKLR